MTEQHEKVLARGRELRKNAKNPQKSAEVDPVDRDKNATHPKNAKSLRKTLKRLRRTLKRLRKTLKRLRRTNRLQVAQFRLQKPGK